MSETSKKYIITIKDYISSRRIRKVIKTFCWFGIDTNIIECSFNIENNSPAEYKEDFVSIITCWCKKRYINTLLYRLCKASGHNITMKECVEEEHEK